MTEHHTKTTLPPHRLCFWRKSLLICFFFFAFLATFSSKQAQAACCCCAIDCGCCNTIYNSYAPVGGYLEGNLYSNGGSIYNRLVNYLQGTYYNQFIVNGLYQDYIVNEFWKEYILSALKDMTSQLTATAVYLTGVDGKFRDARQQIETQREIQGLQANAVRDYTPSDALCRFGTGVRSLAESETKDFFNQVALTNMSLRRQLGNRGGQADGGDTKDTQSRMNQFIRLYCDPADNNGTLAPLCNINYATTSEPDILSKPRRFNKDIDFTRTIGSAMTLNLNYGDGALTQDEEDVVALSNNLFGVDVMRRLTESTLKDSVADPEKRAQTSYLDLRQIAALRSVPVNSFAAITAMKSKSSPGAGQFLRQALEEMGFSAEEASRYLGSDSVASGEPSYYAQMEVLTKKFYQNPNFYTNLIDKPANVERQKAAMQAFGLMQDRDIFQSLERQEMLISVLLELKLRRAQTDMQAGGVGDNSGL